MTENCTWKLTSKGLLVVLERGAIADWRRRIPTYNELKKKSKTGVWVRRICTLGDGNDPYGQMRGIF